MTHDKRRAEAARIRDDAEERLVTIHMRRTRYIASIWAMGDALGLIDTDFECLEGHIEDIESDLFADEIKELQMQIETASDIADQSYTDHKSTRGE